MSNEKLGDVVEKFAIGVLIESEEFFQLNVVKPTEHNGWKSYWEITFECKERGEDGLWRTSLGQLIPTKLYKVYKLK